MNEDPLRLIKTRGKSPAPSKHSGSINRSSIVVLTLLGAAALVSVAAAGTVIAGPVLASVMDGPDPGTGQPAAPTHPRSFAQAWIPKPTYTTIAPFASAPTATLPALEFPTAVVEAPAPVEPPAVDPLAVDPVTTPGALFAELVADTPTAEYAAPAAAEPAQAQFFGGNKYILVDISEQHMYVYESEMLLYSFVASTGMNNATATGQFSVLDKIPSAYGSTWDIWMPNWMGIYWAGGLENGIHALPILPSGATLWSGLLGRPISYGCVVLGTYEAQVLYDWAEVGTPVEIRW